MIDDFQGMSPAIDSSVFIAPTASVIGEVIIGEGSSVWHSAVVRGDCWKISIGNYSNIQDGAVCHVTTGGPELIVGDYVTVGHNAVVHSCRIEDGALIGMGAVVLDGAVIGAGSIVAAGSVVLEKTVVPPGSLVAGIPGVVRRELSVEATEKLRSQAEEYYELARSFMGTGKFTREIR